MPPRFPEIDYCHILVMTFPHTNSGAYYSQVVVPELYWLLNHGRRYLSMTFLFKVINIKTVNQFHLDRRKLARGSSL